jgi:hypothetical protein
VSNLAEFLLETTPPPQAEKKTKIDHSSDEQKPERSVKKTPSQRGTPFNEQKFIIQDEDKPSERARRKALRDTNEYENLNII